jgi:MYXO-CTERM domain-containing protein
MKLNSKSPSKRSASLQPLPLAVYLTGAVGSTFLASAPQAEAAVTSVTFGFGSVLRASDNIRSYNTSTTPNYGTIMAIGETRPTGDPEPFPPFYYTVSLGAHPFANKDLFYHNRLGYAYGFASFLANGAIVGGGGNGALGIAYFYENRFKTTTDQLNKNIGFKTATNNWGWANVSWDATAKALTINSAYIESEANTPITIAAIPEPSRALLALAGLGAAALRRRRKQAA